MDSKGLGGNQGESNGIELDWGAWGGNKEGATPS